MAEAPSSGLSAASETVAIETFVNSPDFFQRLFEQLYEGVYFVDAQRRITYWNRAAHRISGYSAEEVTGHFCQGQHPQPRRRGRHAALLRKMSSDGHHRDRNSP